MSGFSRTYNRKSSEIAIVKPTMMTMRRTPFGPMRLATPAPHTAPTIAPDGLTSVCGHDAVRPDGIHRCDTVDARREKVLEAVHLMDVGEPHDANAASMRMPMPAPK